MGSSASTSKISESYKQETIMICANCSSSLNFLNKKKCSLCSQTFCSKCLNVQFSFSKTPKTCQKCSKLQSGKFNRNDLEVYSVKELRQYLSRSQIPLKNCCEKSDLISLVLKTSPHGTLTEDIEHRMHVQHLREKMEKEIMSTAHTSNLVIEHSMVSAPEISIITADNSEIRGSGSIEPQDIFETNSARGTDIPSTTNDPNELNSHLEDMTQNSQSQENTNKLESCPESGELKLNPAFQFKSPVRLEDITDLSQVEQLNVRQMKELLTRNFVNYKGCCEKEELSGMVISLWKEHSRNNLSCGNLEQSSNVDLCKICMDRMIDCVLLECGHMVACKKCSKQLAECPICRKYVSRVVHVFRA